MSDTLIKPSNIPDTPLKTDDMPDTPIKPVDLNVTSIESPDMPSTPLKPLDMPDTPVKPADMSETTIKPAAVTDTPIKSLDLKGLLCPMPIIKVARAIKEINIGETIEAFASDPGIMADIPAWSRSTGNELVTLEKLDKQFHFVVRRTK